MKDTATRAREARLRKLRRDAMQLIFWLSVGFIAVLVTATAARAGNVQLIPIYPEGSSLMAQSKNSVLKWPGNQVRLHHNPAGSPLPPKPVDGGFEIVGYE